MRPDFLPGGGFSFISLHEPQNVDKKKATTCIDGDFGSL